MNVDTVIGVVVIGGLIFAVRLIDKPRHGQRKDSYHIRIEDEFKDSLDTFANKTLEQMSAHYGLSMKLRKLTTELDFVEVNDDK